MLPEYIAVAKKIVATTVALVTDPVSPTPEIVKTIPLFISWNLDDIVLLVCLFREEAAMTSCDYLKDVTHHSHQLDHCCVVHEHFSTIVAHVQLPNNIVAIFTKEITYLFVLPRHKRAELLLDVTCERRFLLQDKCIAHARSLWNFFKGNCSR